MTNTFTLSVLNYALRSYPYEPISTLGFPTGCGVPLTGIGSLLLESEDYTFLLLSWTLYV